MIAAAADTAVDAWMTIMVMMMMMTTMMTMMMMMTSWMMVADLVFIGALASAP